MQCMPADSQKRRHLKPTSGKSGVQKWPLGSISKNYKNRKVSRFKYFLFSPQKYWKIFTHVDLRIFFNWVVQPPLNHHLALFSAFQVANNDGKRDMTALQGFSANLWCQQRERHLYFFLYPLCVENSLFFVGQRKNSSAFFGLSAR